MIINKEIIKNADKKKFKELELSLRYKKNILEENFKTLLNLETELSKRRQELCEHKWVHVCEYDDRYTYCRLCNAEK